MKRMLVAVTIALGLTAPAAFAQTLDATPNQHYRNENKSSETTKPERKFKFDVKEPSHESPTYID